MGQYPHYFIAVPLPTSVKQWLSSWQLNLKSEEELGYKLWTHEQDLHITLKFLGAVADDQLQSLLTKLEVLDTMTRFELTIGKIGTFGNSRQPRVLWAGVNKTGQLDQLQQRVEDIGAELDFPKEKREYRPHITLAKKWNGHRIDEQTIQSMKSRYRETKEVLVDRFVVYHINPSKSPKYEVIKTIELS